jgi:hypothetical protein
MPESYWGETWYDYYVGPSRHRDSDDLTESNFHTALKDLGDDEGEETETVFVVRESHWAVGFVEWIAVHKDDEAAVAKLTEIEAALEQYPVLDEEDLSEREMDSANQTWQNCYDDKERLEYIRENPTQFDFRSWADLRAVVKGEYFNGYPSELLY